VRFNLYVFVAFARSGQLAVLRSHKINMTRKYYVYYKVRNIIYLISIVDGGIQLGSLSTAATNTPIVPTPGDYDDGEIGGMIGRGNRTTRRKPAPMPVCAPQTPHAARTR
jgi:hypothetical protein